MPIHYVSELLVTLLRATGNHTYKRITSDVEKKAYLNAMKQCLILIEECKHDYFLLMEVLESTRDKHAKHPILDQIFSDPKKYHKLACNHAINALTSLMLRFVTGSCTLPLLKPTDNPVVYDDTRVF